jgi:hypothetical protein
MSFKSVANKIAKKQGVSTKEASAELAASTRNASRAAHERNPKLNNVAGGNNTRTGKKK